ncbi:MAG: hypothetical protein LAO05_00360 [Acidobacteriia bacterium]|nr:hypothetical protein [Terriglobia bacterium]
MRAARVEFLFIGNRFGNRPVLAQVRALFALGLDAGVAPEVRPSGHAAIASAHTNAKGTA